MYGEKETKKETIAIYKTSTSSSFKQRRSKVVNTTVFMECLFKHDPLCCEKQNSENIVRMKETNSSTCWYSFFKIKNRYCWSEMIVQSVILGLGQTAQGALDILGHRYYCRFFNRIIMIILHFSFISKCHKDVA